MQSIIELVLALSVHDKASRGHSERVRVFTDLLADELKVPENGRNRLRWAALLHDIGKLEVPATILNKPGAPSEEEWADAAPPSRGGGAPGGPAAAVAGGVGACCRAAPRALRRHRLPPQLKGHEISLAARIVAVADAYEVMTAPRPYKRPMSVSAARKELVRVAGTQLDPVIVRAFLNVSVGRLWQTIGFGAWIAQIPQLGRLFGVGQWASTGMSMGIASATTATVLAVTRRGRPRARPGARRPGVGRRSRRRHRTPRVRHAKPTATARAGHGARHGDARPPTAAADHRRRPPAPTATATAAPTAEAHARPDPEAHRRPPPRRPPRRPTPTPTPRRRRAQRRRRTRGAVPGCTNTSPTCTNHCNSNGNTHCITYCKGNGNSVVHVALLRQRRHALHQLLRRRRQQRCITNCRDTSVGRRYRGRRWWRSRPDRGPGRRGGRLRRWPVVSAAPRP